MIVFLLLLFESSHCRTVGKEELCKNLTCDDTTPVCGIKQEGEGFRLKEFDNECSLLKNGCLVDDDEAYGIINMKYCENSFKTNLMADNSEKICAELECPLGDDKEVCALRRDDNGFRVRVFDSKCQLWKYNCENDTDFVETDSYICNGMHNTKKPERNDTEEFDAKNNIFKTNNLVIVDNMINFNDVNESIDNFFATTHVFDLPLSEMTDDPGFAMSGRRMHIKNAGHVQVFKPLTIVPKNVSKDVWHYPMLSSCFHKCPTKCPATYAPVCGVPGISAREPVLTFQNHCFMDAAQCKMKWENKGPTAQSSFYIESSFIFCLGEELNSMYRFLPLIRTLQNMGRLKKKGTFRYKLRNLRFFNNFLSKSDPKFMG